MSPKASVQIVILTGWISHAILSKELSEVAELTLDVWDLVAILIKEPLEVAGATPLNRQPVP